MTQRVEEQLVVSRDVQLQFYYFARRALCTEVRAAQSAVHKSAFDICSPSLEIQVMFRKAEKEQLSAGVFALQKYPNLLK